MNQAVDPVVRAIVARRERAVTVLSEMLSVPPRTLHLFALASISSASFRAWRSDMRDDEQLLAQPKPEPASLSNEELQAPSVYGAGVSLPPPDETLEEACRRATGPRTVADLVVHDAPGRAVEHFEAHAFARPERPSIFNPAWRRHREPVEVPSAPAPIDPYEITDAHREAMEARARKSVFTFCTPNAASECGAPDKMHPYRLVDGRSDK